MSEAVVLKDWVMLNSLAICMRQRRPVTERIRQPEGCLIDLYFAVVMVFAPLIQRLCIHRSKRNPGIRLLREYVCRRLSP
jgi:hypothetical protein